MSRETPVIHTLPVETLSHIFRYLVHVDPSANPERRKELPSALILRLVCRRWLAVATETSELWLELVGPYGLEWTRRALLSSKNLALDLNIVIARRHNFFKDLSDSLPLLEDERHRVRKLKIDCTEALDLERDIIHTLFSAPLPRLEELDLNAIDHVFDEHALSGAIPPLLKKLSLDSCTLMVNCVFLRAQLTLLDIHDCPIWASTDFGPVTATEVFPLARNAQHLR